MNTLRTPSNLELLLHCHTTPTPHPRLHAPAIQEGIATLLRLGVIEPIIIRDSLVYPLPEGEVFDPKIYHTTPLGEAWVRLLCNTPIPKQIFTTQDGRPIPNQL